MKVSLVRPLLGALLLGAFPVMVSAQIRISDPASHDMITLSRTHVGAYNQIVATDNLYSLITANLYSRPALSACPARMKKLSAEHRDAKIRYMRLWSGQSTILSSALKPILDQTLVALPASAALANDAHVISMHEAPAGGEVSVRVRGSGVTTLVLDSDHSVNWRIVSDPGVVIKKVILTGIEAHRVVGVSDAIVQRIQEDLGNPMNNTEALGFLDGLMRKEGYLGIPCSDLAPVQTQGSYTGKSAYTVRVLAK